MDTNQCYLRVTVESSNKGIEHLLVFCLLILPKIRTGGGGGGGAPKVMYGK